MHPSSGWRAGGLVGRRGSAPADPRVRGDHARAGMPAAPRPGIPCGSGTITWARPTSGWRNSSPTRCACARVCASSTWVAAPRATSLFLAVEYDLEVWAADLWIDPTDNLARIREAGLDQRVYPLSVDAAALPFADEWFDALFSVDAYHYFGMSGDFLESYAALVRRGGQIGIVVPGDSADSMTWDSFRSANWWRALWEGSGLVDIELADDIPGGRALWLRFLEANAAWTGTGELEDQPDGEVLFSEHGAALGFTRVVANRR